jgi:hypothetical protein
MPPTVTYENIKAYQDKIEKQKITPESLPPCPRCNIESICFKIHAYRERRFLIIVEMIIRAVFCPLVRFKCPGCGKTITFYPDFAVPHKHYTRQTVLGFATAYLKTDATYEQAVIVFELRAVINCLHSPGRRPFCFWRNFHQLCINFFV